MMLNQLLTLVLFLAHPLVVSGFGLENRVAENFKNRAPLGESHTGICEKSQWVQFFIRVQLQDSKSHCKEIQYKGLEKLIVDSSLDFLSQVPKEYQVPSQKLTQLNTADFNDFKFIIIKNNLDLMKIYRKSYAKRPVGLATQTRGRSDSLLEIKKPLQVSYVIRNNPALETIEYRSFLGKPYEVSNSAYSDPSQYVLSAESEVRIHSNPKLVNIKREAFRGVFKRIHLAKNPSIKRLRLDIFNSVQTSHLLISEMPHLKEIVGLSRFWVSKSLILKNLPSLSLIDIELTHENKNKNVRELELLELNNLPSMTNLPKNFLHNSHVKELKLIHLPMVKEVKNLLCIKSCLYSKVLIDLGGEKVEVYPAQFEPSTLYNYSTYNIESLKVKASREIKIYWEYPRSSGSDSRTQVRFNDVSLEAPDIYFLKEVGNNRYGVHEAKNLQLSSVPDLNLDQTSVSALNLSFSAALKSSTDLKKLQELVRHQKENFNHTSNKRMFKDLAMTVDFLKMPFSSTPFYLAQNLTLVEAPASLDLGSIKALDFLKFGTLTIEKSPSLKSLSWIFNNKNRLVLKALNIKNLPHLEDIKIQFGNVSSQIFRNISFNFSNLPSWKVLKSHSFKGPVDVRIDIKRVGWETIQAKAFDQVLVRDMILDSLPHLTHIHEAAFSDSRFNKVLLRLWPQKMLYQKKMFSDTRIQKLILENFTGESEAVFTDDFIEGLTLVELQLHKFQFPLWLDGKLNVISTFKNNSDLRIRRLKSGERGSYRFVTNKKLILMPYSLMSSKGDFYFDGNQGFHTVPEHAFSGASLERLEFVNNPELEHLESHAFSGLKVLNNLAFINNPKLINIEPRAFYSTESGSFVLNYEKLRKYSTQREDAVVSQRVFLSNHIFEGLETESLRLTLPHQSQFLFNPNVKAEVGVLSINIDSDLRKENENPRDLEWVWDFKPLRSELNCRGSWVIGFHFPQNGSLTTKTKNAEYSIYDDIEMSFSFNGIQEKNISFQQFFSAFEQLKALTLNYKTDLDSDLESEFHELPLQSIQRLSVSDSAPIETLLKGVEFVDEFFLRGIDLNQLTPGVFNSIIQIKNVELLNVTHGADILPGHFMAQRLGLASPLDKLTLSGTGSESSFVDGLFYGVGEVEFR